MNLSGSSVPSHRFQSKRCYVSCMTALAVLTVGTLLAGCGVQQSGITGPGQPGPSNTNASLTNLVGNSGATTAVSSNGTGSGSSNGTQGSDSGGSGGSGGNAPGSAGQASKGSFSKGGSSSAEAWRVTPPPASGLSAYGLQDAAGMRPQDLQFFDASDGWIAGGKLLYATKDGGKSWSKVYSGSEQLEQIDFLSPTSGFALMSSGTGGAGQTTGLALWQTNDGGSSWTRVTTASALPVQGLTAGQQCQITFRDAKHGLLSVSGSTEQRSGSTTTAHAYATNDGGHTWKALAVPSGAKAVAYADAFHGLALVSGATHFGIEWTTDGGQTWKTVYTKSAQAELSGDVWMDATGDAWVQVDGGYGMMQESYTLLHSSDSGANWTTAVANATAGGGPAPGVPDANSSMRGPGLVAAGLDLVDGQHAILAGVSLASGQYGLVSTGWTGDGGASWHNGTEQMPGQGGMVSFVNPQHGWLVSTANKRFADVFTTVNGGQSWSLAYQFVLSQDGAQNGRITDIHYQNDALAKIGATGLRDGVQVYLPTKGLDNDVFHIVKTNGDNSVGLVYDHLWVIESSKPLAKPAGPQVNYEEQLGGSLTNHSDGDFGNYVETTNQQGQVNKFLFFKQGDTYVSIQYLQPGSVYSDRQLVQVANSLGALAKVGQ